MDLELNTVNPAEPDGVVAARASHGDLQRAVAADLAAVFDHAPPPSRDLGWITPPQPVQSLRPSPPAKRKAPSAALPITAGLLLALAGLAGGVMLSRRPAARAPDPLLALQASAPQPMPAPAAPRPTPAPTPTPSATEVRPAPVLAAPLPTISPPPVALRPAAPVEIAKARPEPAAPQPPRAPEPLRRPGEAAAAQLKAMAAQCDRGGPCSRETVVRADRLMAQAYAEAQAASSGGLDLTDFRRRWDNLRSDAADSPQALLGNYAFLAHDLARTAQAARPALSRRATEAAER